MRKQFKVGDKVRAITDARSKFGVHKGEVYTVDEVSEYRGTVHLVGQPTTTHHMFERFELVEEVTPKFKVGDRVRVAREGTGNELYFAPQMAHYVGRDGVIEAVTTQGNYTISGFDGWIFAGAWLELITEPATVYKVISTDYPECLEWSAEYSSVEEAEKGIRKNAEPGRTFEIYSVVRTVHKTVKLTERTETIRELEAV